MGQSPPPAPSDIKHSPAFDSLPAIWLNIQFILLLETIGDRDTGKWVQEGSCEVICGYEPKVENQIY